MARPAPRGLVLGAALLAACESPPITVDTVDTGEDSETDVPDGPLELCVNEFMPSNDSALVLDDDSRPDWIELHNPGPTSVPLVGWTLTDDPTDPRQHTLDGVQPVPAYGFVVLYADGSAQGGQHLDFRLSADGGVVGLYAPDGRGALVSYGEVASDFSAARVTDCCTGRDCWSFVFRGTPGTSNVPEVLEDVDVLAAGSTWRYLDTREPPADGWREAGFDDSAWPAGPAPLGYGDAHQVTVLSFGEDPGNKPVTAWARLTFSAADVAGLRSLGLRLMRDDGAAVSLNGVEVARSNLPEGELTATTLASATVAEPEETAWIGFELDPSVLREGDNVLAVEVHQASPSSSDLTFDLALVGQRVVRP